MGTPIRREGEVIIIQNPWTLEETVISGEEISHVVEDGSLDTANVKREIGLDCGCLVSGGAKASGFCSLCVALSGKGVHCDKHLTMCEYCLRPVCIGHLVLLSSEAEELRVCAVCHEAMKPSFLGRLLDFLCDL